MGYVFVHRLLVLGFFALFIFPDRAQEVSEGLLGTEKLSLVAFLLNWHDFPVLNREKTLGHDTQGSDLKMQYHSGVTSCSADNVCERRP